MNKLSNKVAPRRMSLEQAARQALEALIVAEEFVNRHSEDWYISGQKDLKQIREAITAQREALAEQSEQEPVGWYKPSDFVLYRTKPDDVFVYAPLYASPLAQQDTHATHVVRTKDPCHPWQDLTDDEIESCWVYGTGDFAFARAVIAADREKNK